MSARCRSWRPSKRSICYQQVFARKHREATIIHQWKKALLEGAAGIFEIGGQAAATAEIAEDMVHDLHAKIGELAVANDFLSRKLKP